MFDGYGRRESNNRDLVRTFDRSDKWVPLQRKKKWGGDEEDEDEEKNGGGGRGVIFCWEKDEACFSVPRREVEGRESGPSTGSFSAFLIPSFHVSILACASVLGT